jgi:hypothetical protein
MRDKKYQYYITQRNTLLKKMKKRTEKAERVIKRNMSEKEVLKASRFKESVEAEEKIRKRVVEHFKVEETQRQALEVEIDDRSKEFCNILVHTIADKHKVHLEKVKNKFFGLNLKIDDTYSKCKERIEKHYEDKRTENEQDAFHKYERWVKFLLLL